MLKEIRERERRATKGPWRYYPDWEPEEPPIIWAGEDNSDDECAIASCEPDGVWSVEEMDANADFIAHARTDIPYLLSLMERMAAFVRRIERWDFDIQGDCVEDARKEARAILEEVKDEQLNS